MGGAREKVELAPGSGRRIALAPHPSLSATGCSLGQHEA